MRLTIGRKQQQLKENSNYTRFINDRYYIYIFERKSCLLFLLFIYTHMLYIYMYVFF